MPSPGVEVYASTLWERQPLALLGKRIFWSGLAKGFLRLTRNHSQKQDQGERRRGRPKALFIKYFLNPRDVPSIGHMASTSGAGVKCLEGEGGKTEL